MTKTKICKILVLMLVFVSLLCCFVACDNLGGDSAKYNVTYMDGETSLGSAALEPGSVITPITPTKNGYTFVGWYKDAAFTDPFVDGSTIEDNITLYAKFAAKAVYIMVASEEEVTKVAVTQGEAYTLTAPEKVGYDFEGFTYYDDDGKEQPFNLTGVYTFASSIRVTAKWKIKTLTVNLVDGNDVANPQVEYGSKVTLEKKSKEGYTFLGWFDEEDVLFDKDTPITEDITLTAKYQANTYRVTINSKGGSAIDVQTVTYGEAFTLPVPTKTGYDFAGYQQLDESIFLSTGIYQWTKDITLIATWTLQSYDVSFDLDGIAVDTQTVNYGEYATLPDAEAGYEYKVYADAERTQEVTVATTAIAGAKTFYLAKVAKVYTITVEGLPKGQNTFTATYNGTYTLAETPEKEGYIFNKYTFNAEDFAYTGTYSWTEDITVVAEFDIDAMYNKVIITLVDGSIMTHKAIITTKTVEKNATTVTLSDVNTAKTGYTFVGWYTDSALENAYVDGTVTFTEYTDLYAKYTLNSWTITIDEKGGNDVDNVTCDYNGSYTLPELTKKGYTFAGYKYGENNFAQTGTYDIDKDITVVAQWTRNEITVVFMNGETQHDSKTLYQYQTIADAGVTAPTKTGYTFSKWQIVDPEIMTHVAYKDFANDAEIETDTTFYALFTANSYKITLDFDYDGKTEEVDVTYDSAYDLTTINPIRAGYNFVKYQYNSADFSATGTYTYASDITITLVWEEDATVGTIEENGYFKERSTNTVAYTYVFLIGNSYDFSDYYSKVEELNPSEAIGMFYTDGDTKFTPAKEGTFTLKLTPKDGVAYERSAKVVHDVDSYAFGVDYAGMVSNAANSNLFMTTTQAVQLDVGKDNFIVETAILDATTAITLEQANTVVTAKDGDADVSGKVTLAGNVLTFDSELVDKTIVLTFAPKYALSASKISNLTLTVNVNNGTNVYTSADMKSAYSNANIQKINVLRNIQAELADSDYYKDLGGKGKTIADVEIKDGDTTVTLEDIDTGTPINDFTHSVYTRITTNTSDNLVINGNYFQIDGSKLPYIDNRYDTYGSGGSQFTDGGSYRIANVQTGLFLYICGQTTGAGTRYADGNVTFNNLTISGNNIPEYSAYTQDLGDGDMPLLKMSASYIGIVNRGGTVNVENTTITNTLMGFMLSGDISGNETDVSKQTQAVVLNMNNSMIGNSWANSIYTYDLCKVNLTNSKIGQSYGAAISVDDKPKDSGACQLNTLIVMDKYTATNINNFIAGDEAWFVAYGKSSLATDMKSNIEYAVSQATSGTMTIIQKTGSVEKMNFVIFVRSAGSYDTSKWETDKDKQPKVDVQTYSASGANFFYGDGELDASVAQNNLPYQIVSTASAPTNHTYNDVMWVYIPMYTK